MNIIGIDIGTTSVCGVKICASTGEILESKTVNSDAFISGLPFEKIQSVEKIVSVADGILSSLLDSKTAAIGVTGQMHGILYVDKEGIALGPLYTWQDERGNEPYKNTTYAKYLKSHTGYGCVTDFYNKENGIRPKNAVTFCTIHDYYVMHLCSLKKPIIHSTDAASFGLFDIKNNKSLYEPDAEIVSDYRIAGHYKNVPVAVAIGDNQASVLSTLTDEDAVLVNVGTGSQISLITEKIKEFDGMEIRPYFDNKYLLVGAALCGGRAYSLLKDFYKRLLSYTGFDGDVYSIMDKMLNECNGSTLRVDTRFAGTRENPNISGAVTNITTSNFTPEQLTAGVLEGMIDELLSMYRNTGIEKKSLIGSGNGVRKNAHLIKIASEKFGALMKIPVHREEAAVGAALFSAVSAGVSASMKNAQKLINLR